MTDLITGLYKSKVELLSLPYDLQISTSTITCHLDIKFNVKNIGLYFDDFDDILIQKKYGNREIDNKTNKENINTLKKINKKKKNFYNQVSLIFNSAALMGLDPDKISAKEKDKTINIKLFINGSIQMTGCKHLDNIKKSLEILFIKLKNINNINKIIYTKNNNKDLIHHKDNLKDLKDHEDHRDVKDHEDHVDHGYDEDHEDVKDHEDDGDDEDHGDDEDDEDEGENYNKSYVNDVDMLDIKKITKFKIVMINTNFNILFQINRERLYHLLKDSNYDVTFDPITHACVNIKYHLKDNPMKAISIFVFESGSITIAGSNSCQQVLETYNFINKFILSNYDKLLTKNITPKLILQLIQNMK